MNRAFFSQLCLAAVPVLLIWCSVVQAADAMQNSKPTGATDFEEILDLSPPVRSSDIPAWVERLTAKAKKGDTEAQEVLGKHLMENSDFEAAIEWFEKAAAKGSRSAECGLGTINERKGRFGEAVKWYDRAAAKNDAVAEFALAKLYECGVGVPQNQSEATNWYQKALISSPGWLLISMAKNYDIGNGVPRNYQESVRLYRAAAEKGELDAEISLGRIYFEGRGVPGVMQDYAEAVVWWTKAANRGDAGSMVKLSAMYEKGLGVTADPVEAYKWLAVAVPILVKAADSRDAKIALALWDPDRAASDSHNPDPSSDPARKAIASAETARDTLAKQLSPQQLADGQHRASVFVVK